MSDRGDQKTISDDCAPFEAIVREYADVWQRALQAVALPDVDSFLNTVPEESRPALRSVLSDVDQQFFRQLTDAQDDRTVTNWADETVVASPPPDEAPTVAGPVAGISGQSPDPSIGHVTSEAGDEPPDETAPTLLGAPSDEQPEGDVVSGPPVAAGVGVDAGDGEAETYVPREATPTDKSAGEPFDQLAPTLTGAAEEADADSIKVTAGPGMKSTERMGPVIPGYDIDGVLGRGGMGVVYRARQRGLNRTVALKMVLNADHADDEQLKRFQLEAEAVAQLQHPNIVQVFEIGTADGLPFFSLEFVDGQSLEQFRDGKPLPPRQAAEMIATIARAMHSAHERGIVHRDLKPANVLITGDGVPKVTDFGLVKRVEADSSQTRTGAIMGTPSYMAPEQAWGKTDVGPAADVYSLGATLYVLLTGRPPFQGPTPLDTVMQIRNEEAVAPSRLQPGVDRDLETICLKALQKDPQGRYGNANALAEDLERFLRHEPILARPVSRGERVWRWCRRNPALSTAAGVAVVLALCLMVGGPTAAAMIYQQKQIAEQQTEIAEEKEADALANLQLAKEKEAEARENLELAEDNYDTARTQRDMAVSTLYFIAEEVYDSLNDRPRMKPVQTKLLLNTLNRLEQVAELDEDEVKVDVVKARSFRKMGDVLLGTGLAEHAYGQYERAHEIVLAMADAGNPEKPHVPKLNLGRSYENLGKAAQGMSDAPKALDYFQKSLEVRTAALEVAPDPLFVKQEMASACGHLGNLHLAMGQPDSAVDYFEQARQLRQAWRDKAPGSIPAVREFAGVQMTLARALAERGRFAEALDEYGSALESLERVAEAESQSLSSQGNLAYVRMQIGTVHLYDDRPDDAHSQFQKAVDILERVLKSDPDDARLQRKLATGLYSVGVAALEAGDRQEFDDALKRCATIREELAQKASHDVTLQVDLMLALARTGDSTAVQKIGAEVAEQIADDASQLYVAAGAYAVASGEESDEALSGALAKRAIETLETAVARGYRSMFLLEHDPDLDAIRDRPQFRAIVQDVAKLADESAELSASTPDRQ